MLKLELWSQRDARWKDDKYGESENTIGQLGCATTCVASILKYYGYDTDPKRLDDLLVSNKGYSQKTLIIWSKVAELFPKVKFEGRFYSYTNTKVIEWLARGIPVLVQVDAAPIGAAGTQHWVVFIGDKKVYDPWTGAVTPTDKWTPTGMAVFSGTPPANSEFVSKEDYDRAITEKDTNWQFYQKELKLHEATKEELRKANERIIKLEEDKTDLIAERKTAEDKAGKYQKEHTDFLEKLALKLNVTSDAVAIDSELDVLMNKEDKTIELESRLRDERSKYEKTISDLKEEARALKEKVTDLQVKINNLQKPEPELPPEPPRLGERIRA